MSVSLCCSARRTEPLTAEERAAVDRIAAARLASFPYADEEPPHLYDGGGGETGQVPAGSTRLPGTPDRLLPVIGHVLDSVTELRRALPDAAWHVHLDDLDVDWDEREGYGLPRMRDAGLLAELDGLRPASPPADHHGYGRRTPMSASRDRSTRTTRCTPAATTSPSTSTATSPPRTRAARGTPTSCTSVRSAG
ncbi:hypothetical protein [Streptomyces sp. NPDC012589]|uniref:hypothetical protein n=1 Tax=Streptomyces sp. NPDC012589 TaxID=3364839 RepID=UPI0036A78D3E